MIDILDKKDCCGCGACMQKCPKQCIQLKEDEEGFLYPLIDKEGCIDCGLCEKTCPMAHEEKKRIPLRVYAAFNENEVIRMQSSSGGIFTALAEKTIKENGVVFGARFDKNWEVKHDCTETMEGLAAFRGSKYVQSRIENNYRKAETFLKEGRKVLFSGTPCHIAGLRCFLNKEYKNLTTVDFICHGVPSPRVWRKYLEETIARQCEKNSVSSASNSHFSELDIHVVSIQFRNKMLGWKKYSFALSLSTTNGSGLKNTVSLCESNTQNSYLKGFIANLYLRPSCHSCPFKGQRSGSDITIADFWGIHNSKKEFGDNKGISAILVNREVQVDISCYKELVPLELFSSHNPAFDMPVKYRKRRDKFFREWKKKDEVIPLIEKYAPYTLGEKIIRTLYNLKRKYL